MEKINKQKEYLLTVRSIFTAIEFNVTEPCELKSIVENVCDSAHAVIAHSLQYDEEDSQYSQKEEEADEKEFLCEIMGGCIPTGTSVKRDVIREIRERLGVSCNKAFDLIYRALELGVIEKDGYNKLCLKK